MEKLARKIKNDLEIIFASLNQNFTFLRTFAAISDQNRLRNLYMQNKKFNVSIFINITDNEKCNKNKSAKKLTHSCIYDIENCDNLISCEFTEVLKDFRDYLSWNLYLSLFLLGFSLEIPSRKCLDLS